MVLAGSPAGIPLLGRRDDTSERLNAQLHGQNSNIAEPTAQYPLSGNRCGHNKNDPKFIEGHPRLQSFPHIIKRAHSFLEAAYHDPKEYWRSLNFLDNKLKRSERREACIAVGRLLNLRNDLRDFSVKLPSRDIAFLSNLSHSRVIQALKDLTRAGYLRTTRLIKHCFKGAWYGITAIRQITDKFYLELGVSDHAIYSAKCHKSGNNMKDTRLNMEYKPKKIVELIQNPANNSKNTIISSSYTKPEPFSYSPVNKKPFYHSEYPPLYNKSIADEIKESAPKDDQAIDLVATAKEEAAITGEPWTKVLRRLVKSPPST